MLFFLIVGHALADYPLQNGPMAIEKCRRSSSDLQKVVPWYYWLTAHALIHGGFVGWITQSAGLGILETVCHWSLDYLKCEGWTNIHIDQLLHIVCKVVWYLLLINGITLRFE